MANKYKVKNIVSLLGCNITDSHVKYLQCNHKIPVLIYDKDTAGDMALSRTIDMFKEKSIFFKIFELPKGMDLCDYCNSVKDAAENNISTYAISYPQYELDKIISGYNNVKNDYKLKNMEKIYQILNLIPDKKQRLLFEDYIEKQLDINFKGLI